MTFEDRARAAKVAALLRRWRDENGDTDMWRETATLLSRIDGDS